MYDCKNNVLYFNKDKMTDEYDFRHILMYELINIISSNGFQTGFNSEGRFEALNTGYTEILANFLVGNNGSKLIYPNEAVMANMIGVMAGEDKEIKAAQKMLIKRLIYGVVIFFVVTLVQAAFGLVGKNFDNDEYVKDARPCAMCKRVIINSNGCISPICLLPISLIATSRIINVSDERIKIIIIPVLWTIAFKVCKRLTF